MTFSKMMPPLSALETTLLTARTILAIPHIRRHIFFYLGGQVII